MSTTVTYKGQTLTTVENQTKTLQTAGTWVEGDFTLTDVTQGGGGGSGLPSDYREVEYIGTSNGCYFSLGQREYENFGFYAKFSITKRNDTYGPHIISDANDVWWFVPRVRDTALKVKTKENSYSVLPTGTTLEASYNTDTVSNFVVNGFIDAAPSVGATNMATMRYLCCYGGAPDSTAYQLVGTLYRVTFYDNNVKTNDFVPCYRKSDGVIGLYDMVERTFYGNAGSGTLTKGSDVGTDSEILSILLGGDTE